MQGLDVEVVGSRFEENLDKEKLGPVPYVTATALGKANEGCHYHSLSLWALEH